MSRLRTTKEKGSVTGGWRVLIATGLVAATVATPHTQTQDKKQAIWERAQPALMEYMKESAAIVAQGHALLTAASVTGISTRSYRLSTTIRPSSSSRNSCSKRR